MGKTIDRTVDVAVGYEVNKTWRIVETDNLGGDYPGESFVAVGITDELTANALTDILNSRLRDDAPRCFKVVEHVEIAYELQPGFEP